MRTLYPELISLACKEYPDVDFDQLANAAYSETLTGEKQRQFGHLVEFARSHQAKNPIYEPIFQQLLTLYVLNGSRIKVLARLDRRIRGLVDGQASLVLISGNSGIGKTSLVMALRERMAQLGARLVVARCSEQDNMPYAVWRDIAYTLADVNGTTLNEIPYPIGSGREVNSARQLIQETANWIENCASSQPLVILLDDLHWADLDSLNVLDGLTSRENKPKVLFVGTYRSEDRNLGHPFYDYWPKLQRNRQFEHIQLMPLTEQDIQRLVSSHLGPCSPQLSAYLFEHAEGHPFLTVELLDSLVEQGLLVQEDGTFGLPPNSPPTVPIVLRQLITQRVRRLGIEVEQLLSAASVVGETWHLAIVEQLLELSEASLLMALEQALDADLVVAEDDEAETYRFAHGLIKQVLYSQQLARHRKQLHEQIAMQFVAQQPANIYAQAYHFYEAENWEKAVRYYLQSGDLAAKNFASNRALDHYKKGLDAAQRCGKEIKPALHLDLYERLGHAYQVLDQQYAAELTFDRMRDAAQSMGSLEGEVKALVQLTMVRIALYQLDLAEQMAVEALRIAEQIADPRLLAQIHGSLAKLQLVHGNLDQSDYHVNQIQEHFATIDPATQSDAFRQQAYRAIFTGRFEEAQRFAQQSLDYAVSTGAPLYIASGYQILSFIQIESGKYRLAYQNIRSILDFSEMSDHYHHQLSRLLNQMGYLYLELGDARQALHWDLQAVEAGIQSQGVSNYEMQRYSLLNTATDLLHLNQIDEALQAVAQFEAIKEAQNYARFRYYNRYLLLLAELHLAQNSSAKAIDLAREARHFAQNNGATKNIAKSHWLEGQALSQMGQSPKAVRHLEEAVAIADQMQHGSLTWKIRLSLAQAQIEAGKSPKTTIQEARAMIDQTAITLVGTELQPSFLSSPWMAQIAALEKAPVLKKVQYPAGLTQREVEVLGLVARGATNQQVADGLHISVRTVNTHMTNILNKTGCDNRTAASTYAIQHNLLST